MNVYCNKRFVVGPSVCVPLCATDGFVVFESVLSPNTHIGVRENGEVKKPSHTGTRKHAQFTPIMKV